MVQCGDVIVRTFLGLLILAGGSAAQEWDVGQRVGDALSEASGGRLTLTFEQRGRYEDRTGNSFKDAGTATGLIRTRLGLSYIPVSWLKLSGMVQDARAPWYGSGAPNTVRDPADYQEGYIELFPNEKTGFGMTAGRKMLSYGEGRLIGTPDWSALSRTYDHARLYWRSRKARFELLMVSPVKVRIGEFNRPELGDRVWGTYDSFPDLYGQSLLETYVLRHDQNAPGGFTGGSQKDGTDKLTVDTFGFRLAGPLAPAWRYSLEAAFQKGTVGAAELNAHALFGLVARQWKPRGHTLDVSAEYKYASGTANPSDPTRTGTFDQLYAANHDKFGHEDLFGWRNLHNARSSATLSLTKNFSVTALYDNYWLADAKDAIYNSSGKAIARSAAGTAGRHVGQETDLFGTYKYHHFTFGAGYGHFFSGSFIRNTTPGVSPTYLYVFHSYTL
jgi:hypothetical protein